MGGCGCIAWRRCVANAGAVLSGMIVVPAALIVFFAANGAVEQLYSNYTHPRTAILMGHARGVILLVARRQRIEVHEFAANRIKQSLTSHGHTSKEQMQRAIQHQWNLPEPPDPPDVADALTMALCCKQAMETAESHKKHKGHGERIL